MNRQQLESRIIGVAEKTLQTQHYVCCIDILLGIGWLQFVHFDDWRKGRLLYLEQALQVNVNSLIYAINFFQQWAIGKGLKPSEKKYLAKTRDPQQELQFSEKGDLSSEKIYRTYYISSELSEKKQQNLKEKLEKPPETVVFSIITDTSCDQCHKELSKNSFLYKENEKAFCMECGGFSKLVFLPAGDAKQTRRAKLYSKNYAVVVRFSRARKRYERQGLLVEEAALN